MILKIIGALMLLSLIPNCEGNLQRLTVENKTPYQMGQATGVAAKFVIGMILVLKKKKEY